jgi:hypothetical protein
METLIIFISGFLLLISLLLVAYRLSKLAEEI